MSLSVINRRLLPGLVAVLAVATTAPAALAQSNRILSSEISVSRETASLRLELDDGRTLELAVREGRAFIDGVDVGSAPRNGELDRTWRDLLERAIDAPTAELAGLLTGWSPPSGGGGADLDAALEAAMAGVPIEAPSPLDVTPMTDSVDRLVNRISDLERQLADIDEITIRERNRAVADVRDSRRGRGPIARLWNGIEGVLSILLIGTVLFGVGFTTIFFGGRKYIERVADTARISTTRSLLVGLAAMFLVVPTYVLGMIALAISIVGIPALLLWIPLFPIAVVLAGVLGYIGVAHAAGESLAERRFSGTDWFRRGNSYYFLMSGLGLLMSAFLAATIVSITGIDFFSAMLAGIGGVITWAAVCIGLGAVLLSRGGSRPVGDSASESAQPGIYAEETNA